jgi:hypothetical protein
MLLDVVAVIIGILYTIRKLDVRRREPEQFPHVPAADFERWRSLEAGAYSLGSVACFAKILLDYAFIFVAKRAALPANLVRIVGGGLFLAWLAILVLVWIRVNSARKLRSQLGIEFVAPPPR